MFTLMIAGLLIMAIIALLIYMWTQAHANRVCYDEIALNNLPSGFHDFHIFFITDIHRRRISSKIIDQATDRDIDLVIIGGDLTEGGVPFTRMRSNVEALKRIGPVYFVWGNNDYEVDSLRLEKMLEVLGVKILNNSVLPLQKHGDTVQMLGVDDFGLGRARLDWAIEGAGAGYRILISHNPAIAGTIVNSLAHIHLVLSGHTHGGQIRLLGWGPRGKGGMKHFFGLTVFTSNGYGTTTLPLRLGAPAQTHILTLKIR